MRKIVNSLIIILVVFICMLLVSNFYPISFPSESISDTGDQILFLILKVLFVISFLSAIFLFFYGIFGSARVRKLLRIVCIGLPVLYYLVLVYTIGDSI